MTDVRVDWDAVRAEAAFAGVPVLVRRVADAVTAVSYSPLGEVEVALLVRAASTIGAAEQAGPNLRRAAMLWKAGGLLDAVAMSDRVAAGPLRTRLREWAWTASNLVEMLADLTTGDRSSTATLELRRGAVDWVEQVEADADRIAAADG